MFLALKHPLTGQEVPARVVEIEENELLLEINLNPPLAGKYLIFEVKIEEVRDETKEEKEKREEEHKKQVEHLKKCKKKL